MAEVAAPLHSTQSGSEPGAPPRVPRGGHGRSATALILASVLLPALLFAAFAWWSWSRVQEEATGQIGRTADILAEQSLRLLRIEDVLLVNADSRLANLSWPEITAQQSQLDAYLRRAVTDAPEIDSLYIIDASGALRLGTASVLKGAENGAPAPPQVNLGDRLFFQALKNGASLVIEGPERSLVTGVQIVTIARRLSSPAGAFRGAAVATVPLSRIEGTWKKIVEPGDSVALIREDGAFLARYPPAPGGPRPIRAGTTLMPHLKSADAGIFDGPGSPFDGRARRIAFRKLLPFPVYLIYGVDEANITAQWYPVAIAFGLLAAAAALALVFASSAVIRRARGEALAHEAAEDTALALRHSEEHQRTLFRKAPAAMHSLDAQRRVIDVNDSWLALFGYEREAVIGRPITDFYVPAEGMNPEERWRDILQRGGLQDEERECIGNGGRNFHALISVVIERDEDGTVRRVITTVTDITARKRAEAAARGAENFAQLLIENSIDGIIVKDRDLRYTVFNREMERICGISRESVLGRTAEEAFPALELRGVGDAWRAALDGRSTLLQDEAFAFPGPGRSGYCDQNVAPLRDESGAIVGALAFVRETTERRRMEEVLRQAQKMEAVGQLTGGIAHDFNNLLTVILGNLEQMQRHTLPGSDLRRFADTAARGAERAATLTQRLLAFSRRQPLEPRALDINRLVAGVSEMLRRVIGETVTLETHLAEGLWRVYADANQIESALLNLVVNARDAMPQGGRLVIETANAQLEALDSESEPLIPGPYVMVAVSDTGTGMPPDVQARAFEPFYTTKETGRGSGLGLSQVYGFVRQSGGYARIESTPGLGTSVRLYLPRLEGDASPEDARADAPAPARANADRTLLVVEDDPDVRAHSAGLLRELGYRVLEAGDGRAALAILDGREETHLLFTDVGLPGALDGRALAIEARARQPGLKILFTTGYGARAAQSVRIEGFPNLLAKPFTFSALAAKVNEVLTGAPPEHPLAREPARGSDVDGGDPGAGSDGPGRTGPRTR